MALPIPDLDTMTAAEVAADDKIIIDDTSADETKTIEVGELLGLPDLGWTPAGETWSFVSWNSTTKIGVMQVPSDATTKYSVGMWVRIVQATGGTKIGKITAVTSTSISVNFFNLYSLINETITTPFYSPLAQPYGAPSIPVTYTDANGYKVRDFGSHKTFAKTINFNGTTTAPNGRFIAANIVWPVGFDPTTAVLSIEMQTSFAGHMSGSLEKNISGGGYDYYISSMYNGGGLDAGTGCRLNIMGVTI